MRDFIKRTLKNHTKVHFPIWFQDRLKEILNCREADKEFQHNDTIYLNCVQNGRLTYNENISTMVYEAWIENDAYPTFMRMMETEVECLELKKRGIEDCLSLLPKTISTDL